MALRSVALRSAVGDGGARRWVVWCARCASPGEHQDDRGRHAIARRPRFSGCLLLSVAPVLPDYATLTAVPGACCERTAHGIGGRLPHLYDDHPLRRSPHTPGRTRQGCRGVSRASAPPRGHARPDPIAIQSRLCYSGKTLMRTRGGEARATSTFERCRD